MTLKSPTQWMAPGGNGYVNIANNNVYLNPVGNESPLASIKTQSGVAILTQSGSTITVNPNVFSPKETTSWAKETTPPGQWIPKGGYGYVYTNLNYQAAGQEGVPVIPGTNQITDNSGNFLVDNLGDNLVTNDTIVVGKFLTLWSDSGA